MNGNPSLQCTIFHSCFHIFQELLNLGAEEILQRQVEELEKERKDLQLRLRSQEKKVDYFERAKRLVEIPLLKKMLEEEKVSFGNIFRSVNLMKTKQ